MKLDFILELKRVECFKKSEFESIRDKDLKKTFWIRSNTKPIPNSTAERTRKRKVSDNKFKLSYEIPKDNVKKYRVIHSISAVNRRCKAELTFIQIELKIIMNTIINKLASPIYIYLYKLWHYCIDKHKLD